MLTAHYLPPPSLRVGLPSFWEAANGGADLQREVPLERWDVEAGYNPSLVPQGMTIYVRFGAFCSGKHHAESEDGRKGGGGQAEDRVDSRRLPLSALRACSDGLAKLAGK